MDWLQLLINLAVTGVLLYVFQRVIDERSAKRLEKFKAEIQSIAFEQETKFSNLHHIRAEVIAEIYRKLVEIQRTLIILRDVLEYTDVDLKRGEKFENVGIAIEEFDKYLVAKRLYIPDKLCKQLDSFYTESKNTEHILWSAHLDDTLSKVVVTDDDEYVDNYKQDFLKASSALSDRISPLLTEIEKEFRNLLGS